MLSIRIAHSDEEIASCFPVMQQLRPHLVEAEFVPVVRRQQASCYELAYLEEGGSIRAVAGFRLIDFTLKL